MNRYKKNILEFEDEDFDDLFAIWSVAHNPLDESCYKTFYIKKKNGGYREINMPPRPLYRFQREIGRFLLEKKESQLDVSFGFERGKSILDNARKHINKEVVINLDIKDFFKSIKREAVEACLQSKFKTNRTSFSTITSFVTYNGYLPTGSPSSPVISNYICEKMDQQIIDLCSKQKVSYSRYADDLTFSYNHILSPQELIPQIIKILEQYNFKLNKRKIKVFRKNSRQEVTGLTVNEKVNLKREFRYNLKAIFHNFDKLGYTETRKVFAAKFPKKLFLPTLIGWVDHYGFIMGKNDKYYIKYNRLLYGIYIGDNYFEQGLNPDNEISKLKDFIISVIKIISIEEKKTYEEISLKQVIEYLIHLKGREALKKNWDLVSGGYFLVRPGDETDSYALYNYFFTDITNLMNDIIK